MGNEEIRDLAFGDYRKGMKYKDIADKYGVSLSAVKSWAARYWKKEGCNHENKKLQPKEKKVATRGAPEGNQNAVGNKGGAAQPGNKNAIKTGEFETLFFDTLDDAEKRLIGTIQPDKEKLLLQEIQLLTVRERRMLRRIDDLRQMTDDVDPIQSIEDALTRVQARKQRAIETLHKFGFDDARLEIELMKLELMSLKLGGQEAGQEEDGFLDALNTESAELWGDADE